MTSLGRTNIASIFLTLMRGCGVPEDECTAAEGAELYQTLHNLMPSCFAALPSTEETAAIQLAALAATKQINLGFLGDVGRESLEKEINPDHDFANIIIAFNNAVITAINLMRLEHDETSEAQARELLQTHATALTADGWAANLALQEPQVEKILS